MQADGLVGHGADRTRPVGREDAPKPAPGVPGTIRFVTTAPLATSPDPSADAVATTDVSTAPEDAARRRHRPKPTTLVLVRHAVTPQTGPMLSGRTPGIDLSELGHEQATNAGERLKDLPITAVYASPIDRTRQTAEHIAAHHALGVRTLDGVIEADYGEWTGGQLADLAKTDLWKTVQRTPSRARFPNGESIAEMQTRTVAALEAVVAEHPGETIVVVSHADPIKSVIAHFTGVHLDLFQRIAVSPASVTVFVLGPHGVTLVKCNDTGSLAELIPAPPAPAAADGQPHRRGIPDAGAGFDVSMIELDGVDSLGAGAIGEPGARAFYIQADKRGSRLTVLVEKEQVALLAQEAVAFLDRIADDHPEPPAESALLHPSVAQVTEPAVPLFRARMIGLGFEPDRGLVLIELRERAEDDEDDEADEPTTTMTTATSRGSSPRGRRCGRWPHAVPRRCRAGGRRARCASSRWTRPDTSARGGTDARAPSATLLAHGTIEVVGRVGVVVERRAARDGRRPTASRCSRSTSRARASGRCGTSPTARCAGARPRRTSSARRCGGTSCRPRCCATARTASGWCSGSSSTIPTTTTSRCSRRTPTSSGASPRSTSW